MRLAREPAREVEAEAAELAPGPGQAPVQVQEQVQEPARDWGPLSELAPGPEPGWAQARVRWSAQGWERHLA